MFLNYSFKYQPEAMSSWSPCSLSWLTVGIWLIWVSWMQMSSNKLFQIRMQSPSKGKPHWQPHKTVSLRLSLRETHNSRPLRVWHCAVPLPQAFLKFSWSRVQCSDSRQASAAAMQPSVLSAVKDEPFLWNRRGTFDSSTRSEDPAVSSRNKVKEWFKN